MQSKKFDRCEDGDVVLLQCVGDGGTAGGLSQLLLMGESSSTGYGEEDALAAVAQGRANRVLVVKVLAVVERTAQIVPRRKPAALEPPASVFYIDPSERA